MNITFQKGRHRNALILGPITLKFISVDIFFFKNMFRRIGKKEYFRIIRRDWKYDQFRIIRGLFANITEFFTWKVQGSSFLAPTYFSCGFFNIQKTIVGEELNSIELIGKVFDTLTQKEQNELLLIERHSMWDNSGWIKTKDGVLLFDYGDCFLNGLPFSVFLRDYEEEIKKVLSEYYL